MKIIILCLWLTFLCSFQAIGQSTKFLLVPEVLQEPYDYWCWAASSEAVLRYTGNSPGMCHVANWARQQNGWGNDECCTNGTGAICNQANWIWGTAGSIQNIFAHWNADSERFSRSLNLKETQEAIEDDSPVIVRWGWTGGERGHFVILHGYSDSNMEIMDPLHGHTMMTHGEVTSTDLYTWTHTLVVRPEKITYVVDDTGSMWNEIDDVKSTLLDHINAFKSVGRFAKYSLITYKDNVSYRGSTVNHDTIKSWIIGLYADAGGDCPEEGYGALDKAAEMAPNSEIWWMTDADSHGGFVRMLLTRLRLLLAGNTVHSTILGSCSGSSSFAVASAAKSSSQDDSVPYPYMIKDTSALSTSAPSGDLSAYEVGKEVSLGTGGLFFAVNSDDISEATEMVLEESGSKALIERLALSAGSHETLIPVDISVITLKILHNIPAGSTGSLQVYGPDGTEVIPGAAGVREIVAGESRMLVITSPALQGGVYKAKSSSTQDYVLSVSGLSEYYADLLSDTTIGVRKSLSVKLAIPALSPPTGPAGPGEDGLGGPMVIPMPPDPDHPFNPAELNFFVKGEDGLNRRDIVLYDDGLHGEGMVGDGTYGGEIVFENEGNFRIGVTDNKIFQRVTKLLIVSGTVSVTASGDAVATPGSTVEHVFIVENDDIVGHTYDVSASSSSGWDVLSTVPAVITLGSGEKAEIKIKTTVPLTAVSGDTSVLAVTVAAQDNPGINDSTAVTTLAWIGPLLQSLSSYSVHPGEQLTLTGSGFGTDPGSGSRSTEMNNVTIAGQKVPDANVLEWTPASIKIKVPTGITSGLIYVTAAGVQSNTLEVFIVPWPGDVSSEWADFAIVGDTSLSVESVIGSGSVVRAGTGKASIGSNGPLSFGAQSAVLDDGNVQAIGGIMLSEGSAISGNVVTNAGLVLGAKGKIGKSAHAGGDATLRGGARVDGDLVTGGDSYLGIKASVGGAIIEGAMPPTLITAPQITMPTCPANAPGTAGDRKTKPKEIVALTPADYGQVHFGARNTVSLCGAYSFRSLVFGPKTTVTITCPTTLQVEGLLVFGDGVKEQLTGTTAAENVKYFAKGGMSVGAKAVLSGTVCAPQAEIAVGSGTSFTGALYGNKVRLGAQVNFVSSPAVLP